MQDNKSQFQKKIDRLFNYFDVYTEEALAKKLHTTRSAVSQWKFKKRLPEKIRIKYNKIIEGKGETINVKHKDIPVVKEGSKVEMGADYIIELQKDKIETQAQEIKYLKEVIDKKQAESTHWEALEYDFICNVTLVRKGFKIGRIIESVTDLDKQAQTLGYRPEDIEKLWDLGVTHFKMEDHPIEAIINKETQKEIQKSISTLPIIFDAMKTVVGNHYIPQPIIYKHKNGTNIGAISYNKVEWAKMEVVAKVKFLVSE